MRDFDEMQRDLENRVKKSEQKANDQLEKVMKRLEPQSSSSQKMEKPSPIISPGGFQLNQDKRLLFQLGELKKEQQFALPAAGERTEVLSEAHVRQMAQFVIHSPYVAGNRHYSERAQQTTLVFAADELLVNACATDDPVADLQPPLIIIFGGLPHAFHIVSIGLAAVRQVAEGMTTASLVKLIQSTGMKMLENEGQISPEAVREILEAHGLDILLKKNGEVHRQACSYASAMLIGVIGHEMGHLALGHTLGGRQSDEVSRNQEREADSFSSSIISTSPFSDYLVGGTLFWWVLLVWMEEPIRKIAEEMGDTELLGKMESTHPRPVERLQDFLQSHKSQAEALGITPESVVDFLPKKGKNLYSSTSLNRPEISNSGSMQAGSVSKNNQGLHRLSQTAKNSLTTAIEAILFIDIVGSTAMGSKYGDDYVLQMKEWLGKSVSMESSREGVLFTKGTGDGFLLTFPESIHAVRVAAGIMQQTKKYQSGIPASRSMQLRMGIHFGQVNIDSTGDRQGTAVNFTSRIKDAKSDQLHETEWGIKKDEIKTINRIFISDVVNEEIENSREYRSQLVGYFDFQGISGRHRIYDLIWETG
jgi:hypothetical protein